MTGLSESRTIGTGINRDCREVYDFLAEPLNFNLWAAGLGHSLRLEQGRYVGQGPAGSIRVRFSPRNGFGVADHWVELPDGTEVYVPLRVVANDSGSEVTLMLFRPPGMPDAVLAADMAAVERDLAALKRLLEDEHGPR